MLTDIAIRNAKPKAKPYKLTDGGGLHLYVTSQGSRLFRCKYFFAGKERLASFGKYPDVSLAFARQKRDELRRAVAQGVDPRGLKEVVTFEAVARAYVAKKAGERSAGYEGYSLRRLQEVFEALDGRPIDSIEPRELLAVLRKIEARGALTMARKVRALCSRIFRSANVDGLCSRDVAGMVKDELSERRAVRHHPAVAPAGLPELLKRIRAYDGEPVARVGLMMLAHTGLRTSELIGAQWREIEGDLWEVPGPRMKMKLDHLVPLSRQVLRLLGELRTLNPHGAYVFPSPWNPRKHISSNTLLFALYRLGYHSRMTGHGFRAVMSTILNEERENGKHAFGSDVIERQLAHVEKNQSRRPYNRAEYLPARRKMMQWWSNYLDNIDN